MQLLPSWMVLSCLISSLCMPVEKDVWFGKRDLDNDSSGDVFSVNTNMPDLLLTFDPNSKEVHQRKCVLMQDEGKCMGDVSY